MKTILAATLLLWLLAPPPVLAQTVATLGEKSIGTACNNGADAVNFDTLAQCSATSGSGTFQKAPLFVGQVTSPPYATTACDAAKAGMLQYTSTTGFQGCNGSAWAALASGGAVSGYEIVTKLCNDGTWCQPQCPTGKKVLGGGYNYPATWPLGTQSGPFRDGTGWSCYNSGSTANNTHCYAICAYVNTGTGTSGFLGSTSVATSPSRADDGTTGLFSATASTVSIATGGVERLRVTATGNVGIGTTSPARQFTVANANQPIIELKETGAATDSKGWLQYANAGTFYNQLINDAENMGITWMQVQRSGMTVSNVTFPNGNVGIGTTSPSYTLDVNGNARISGNFVRFPGIPSGGGTYTCLNPSTGWGLNVGNGTCDVSDIRLKKKITSLIPQESLERILNLRPVSFEWKDKRRGKSTQLGLIAQEVMNVYPSIPTMNSDGYYTFPYQQLIAPLVGAVQGLKAENDALRLEIKAKDDAFAARLEKLEARSK